MPELRARWTEGTGARSVGLSLFAPLLAGWSGEQSALDPKSPDAALISDLWWAMLIVGTLILVGVTILVLVAVLRAGRHGPERRLDRSRARALIVSGGLILPGAVILGLVLSGAYIGRDIAARQHGDLTIEVVGKRWWWEFNYLGPDGSRIATTANEIHIPVGREVRFLLRSENVIHSFWVPNLQGKTDLIPGRVNETWLTASEPGEYRGQCAEFCGVQHALMGFLVIAEPAEEFTGWLDRQARAAVPPRDAVARRGQAAFFEGGCGQCHTIRGTAARGEVGPDLTHVAGRRTIAAATIPNTPGYLGGWVADPQHVKPGNIMPPTRLPPEDFRALLIYLESLR